MRTARRSHPPGPELSPLAGLRAFRHDPIGLLRRTAAFGDVAYLRLPRTDTYLLNHPDLVWDILVTGNKDFGKGPTIQAAKLMLGESLLTSEEPAHMRQRRLVNPLFHHERIEGYGTSMVGHARRASDTWRNGEVRDVHREMARLTLAIVASTIFATDVGSDDSAP